MYAMKVWLPFLSLIVTSSQKKQSLCIIPGNKYTKSLCGDSRINIFSIDEINYVIAPLLSKLCFHDQDRRQALQLNQKLLQKHDFGKVVLVYSPVAPHV